MAISVPYHSVVRGNIVWTNVNIPTDALVYAVVFLGSGEVLTTLVADSVEYYLGSINRAPVPAMGSSAEAHVTFIVELPGTWDAMAIIGAMPALPPGAEIGYITYMAETIGLAKADMDTFLVMYGSKWYTGVLTVEEAILTGTITGFEFTLA